MTPPSILFRKERSVFLTLLPHLIQGEQGNPIKLLKIAANSLNGMFYCLKGVMTRKTWLSWRLLDTVLILGLLDQVWPGAIHNNNNQLSRVMRHSIHDHLFFPSQPFTQYTLVYIPMYVLRFSKTFLTRTWGHSVDRPPLKLALLHCCCLFTPWSPFHLWPSRLWGGGRTTVIECS